MGLTIKTIPTHLPLPAKIGTELLDPIYVDTDPERVNDGVYADSCSLQLRTESGGGSAVAVRFWVRVLGARMTGRGNRSRVA